jgi:hypothetical protein
MSGPAFDEGLVTSLLASVNRNGNGNGHHGNGNGNSNGNGNGLNVAEQFRFVNGKVHLSVPTFGQLEAKWEPEERERQAAWEMYIELISHVSVTELEPQERVLGEALTSLYLLFDTSRDILRKYGPELGRPNARSSVSFATVAVAAINYVLQPLLSKWHPLLSGHESTRPSSVSIVDWEAGWERASELRGALAATQRAMTEYADLLAQVAKVSPLHRGAVAAGGNGGTNGRH